MAGGDDDDAEPAGGRRMSAWPFHMFVHIPALDRASSLERALLSQDCILCVSAALADEAYVAFAKWLRARGLGKHPISCAEFAETGRGAMATTRIEVCDCIRSSGTVLRPRS